MDKNSSNFQTQHSIGTTEQLTYHTQDCKKIKLYTPNNETKKSYWNATPTVNDKYDVDSNMEQQK